jgi:hypothetical protein
MDAAALLRVSQGLGQLVPVSMRFERAALLGRSEHQDPLLRLLSLRLVELGLALLQLFRLAGIEVVP